MAKGKYCQICGKSLGIDNRKKYCGIVCRKKGVALKIKQKTLSVADQEFNSLNDSDLIRKFYIAAIQTEPHRKHLYSLISILSTRYPEDVKLLKRLERLTVINAIKKIAEYYGADLTNIKYE